MGMKLIDVPRSCPTCGNSSHRVGEQYYCYKCKTIYCNKCKYRQTECPVCKTSTRICHSSADGKFHVEY